MDNANQFNDQVPAALYNAANGVGSSNSWDDNYQVNILYFQPSSRATPPLFDPPAITAPATYPESIPTQNDGPPTPTNNPLEFHEQGALGRFYNPWDASGEASGAGDLAGQEDALEGANAIGSNFAMIMNAAPLAAPEQMTFSHGIHLAIPLARRVDPSTLAPSNVFSAPSVLSVAAPVQDTSSIVPPLVLPYPLGNPTYGFTVPAMSGVTTAGTPYLASNVSPDTIYHTQGHNRPMGYAAFPQFTTLARPLPSTYTPAQIEGGVQMPLIDHLRASVHIPTVAYAAPADNTLAPTLRKPVPSGIPPPPPLFPLRYEAIINRDGQLRAGARLNPRTLLHPDMRPTPEELLIASLRARGLPDHARLLVTLDRYGADSVVCVVCSTEDSVREISNTSSSRSAHRGSEVHTSGWEWVLWLKKGSLRCSGRKRTTPRNKKHLLRRYVETEEGGQDQKGNFVAAGEAPNTGNLGSGSDSNETEEPPVLPPCDTPSTFPEHDKGQTPEDSNEEAASSSVAHRNKGKARATSADLPSWSPLPSSSDNMNHDTGNTGLDMQVARSFAVPSSQPNAFTSGTAAALILCSEGGATSTAKSEGSLCQQPALSSSFAQAAATPTVHATSSSTMSPTRQPSPSSESSLELTSNDGLAHATPTRAADASQSPLDLLASLASRRVRARDSRYRPYRTSVPANAQRSVLPQDQAEGLPIEQGPSNATQDFQDIPGPRSHIPLFRLVGPRGKIPPSWKRFIINPRDPDDQPQVVGDAQAAIDESQDDQDVPDAANTPAAQPSPAVSSPDDDELDELTEDDESQVDEQD